MARMLSIKIDLCHDQDYCMDSEQARRWFDNRWVNVFVNRIIFDPSKFGEESIIKESYLEWIGIEN